MTDVPYVEPGDPSMASVPARVIWDVLNQAWDALTPDITAPLVEALAQPTPTDEPISYPDVWNAAIDRAQEELVRQDQFSERTLRILDEQRIPDPSTIRDVTPPTSN